VLVATEEEQQLNAVRSDQRVLLTPVLATNLLERLTTPLHLVALPTSVTLANPSTLSATFPQREDCKLSPKHTFVLNMLRPFSGFSESFVTTYVTTRRQKTVRFIHPS